MEERDANTLLRFCADNATRDVFASARQSAAVLYKHLERNEARVGSDPAVLSAFAVVDVASRRLSRSRVSFK